MKKLLKLNLETLKSLAAKEASSVAGGIGSFPPPTGRTSGLDSFI